MKNVKDTVHNLAKNFLPRLPFPTELEFEPIQLCNAKCFSCPYTFLQEDKEYRGKQMSREQIENLLNEFGNLMKKFNYKGQSHINPFRFSDPLVCRDLDLILKIAEEHNTKVQITTNAVSLNGKYIEILERFINTVNDTISISVLGSNAEEVNEFMQVNLQRTMKLLKNIAENHPLLRERIKISQRVILGTPEEMERLLKMKKQFNEMGFNTMIKHNWIHNRIDGDASIQSQKEFIKGCKLHDNKLLRRMQVRTNGDVLLCDDDATGKKVFGNVFEQSIEEIWNGSLRQEHELIYQKQFSESKKELICKNCSRADWKERPFSGVHSIKSIGLAHFANQILRNDVKFL